ncbi:hypothetical protein [uncultured Bacteroides sp.]|uniref:hypothetical protein n=1 Tax=uncultured Bacteroides sp. TaxID=162156 RepID=UPI002AAB66B8|nr:hypothetical protein [uncultured Bacteroides sp.]
MKKIYFILIAMLAVNFALTACSDKDPFSTATADDEPRILDPIFPNREEGKLPVVSEISRDANLTMKLTVTPFDYTTVVWQIDGNEVQTGTALDISLKAGSYNLKVTASTNAGKSTYREGIVKVNPLPDDPWATEVGFERIIAPNAKARLYGDNLNKVKSILIDGKTITDNVYVESEGGNYVEYTVPADLAEGEHRVILVDADNNEYGANTVKATKASLITEGAKRATANTEWLMTGINLDNIASLTINGQVITNFSQQSSSKIALTCPELADGDYKLTGKTKGGEDVEFYENKNITTEQVVTVSTEIVLWTGHHYVSWELEDGDPNKTFNLIGKDKFAEIKAGAILSIHYSVAPEATYHKLGTTTGQWNDLPNTAAIEFSQNGVKDVELTKAVLDMIAAQDGFLCVGHGYYVDAVTLK